MVSRRTFLHGFALSVPTILLSKKVHGNTVTNVDIIAHHTTKYFKGKNKTPIMAYNDGFPIIRIKKGTVLRATLHNKLQQETTLHWHGLRLPNAMDGVPMLTQKPVPSGEKFIYEFMCQDAGTFWFHTHIHSKKQLGQGLIGILIVEDETQNLYHNDITWAYHDLNLNKNGQNRSMNMAKRTNRMQAMMTGVHGNFPTINGKPIVQNTHTVQAGSDIRLRFLNTDNTRFLRLNLYYNNKQYTNAHIIAISGNPLPKPIPFKDFRIGASQRVDIAIRMPQHAHAILSLVNDDNKDNPVIIGQLQTTNTVARPTNKPFPHMPHSNPIPVPDIKNSEILHFNFYSNMTMKHNKFWKINAFSWEKENGKLPPPLAHLKHNKTYIFRLKNLTAFAHPIHIHGHVWHVIHSNYSDKIVGHYSDTVTLETNETLDVAFVADNLGDWMYHCHIIDHMVTGMMGYITVEK